MSIALDYSPPDPALPSGTVDLHIHTAPDIFPRNVTAISATRLSSFIRALLEEGFAEAEVRHMSADPPGYLIGLAGEHCPELHA